ncbi:protein ecdysoneless homolog [Chenopodium quinoa]|uniref:protein ecdysoneless homolog n=1 Tax=Chenopodium quinoa TaxID=63459 RepID=UPI000B791BF2|nr:protein ecdysoneless homolog [Chenopodium quinoa]
MNNIVLVNDPNSDFFYTCVICNEIAHNPKVVVCTSDPDCPGVYVCGTIPPRIHCIQKFVQLWKPQWSTEHRKLILTGCCREDCQGLLTTTIRTPPQATIARVNDIPRLCGYPGCEYRAAYNALQNHAQNHHADDEDLDESDVVEEHGQGNVDEDDDNDNDNQGEEQGDSENDEGSDDGENEENDNEDSDGDDEEDEQQGYDEGQSDGDGVEAMIRSFHQQYFVF